MEGIWKCFLKHVTSTATDSTTPLLGSYRRPTQLVSGISALLSSITFDSFNPTHPVPPNSLAFKFSPHQEMAEKFASFLKENKHPIYDLALLAPSNEFAWEKIVNPSIPVGSIEQDFFLYEFAAEGSAQRLDYFLKQWKVSDPNLYTELFSFMLQVHRKFPNHKRFGLSCFEFN